MCENPNFQRIANSTSEKVKQIFSVIIREEAEFCNAEQYTAPNVTLVLGNAGAGKTVFTKWISGNDENLISEEDPTAPGEYAIYDPTKKPSVAFPELMINNNTNAAYYDFPGLNDNEVANDIAITYFDKRTVDMVERIKMVFIVRYDSVTSKAVRDDFRNLIEYVTKFVTNIDKFYNGIALIATRVDKNNVSYDRIIDGIALFLNEVKSWYEKQEAKQKIDYTKEKKLVDVFLSKKRGDYPKIGLFRSPNEAGPINKISLLLENKLNITKMLDELSFVEKDISDLTYALPKSTIPDITDAIEEVRQIVIDNIAKSGDEVQKYFSNKEKILNGTVSDTNILLVYNETKYGHDEVRSVRASAYESTTPKQCVQQIINAVDNFPDIKTDSITQDLAIAFNSSDDLEFLQVFNDYVTIPKFMCAEGLENVMEYLNESQVWYHFLINLYNRIFNCGISQNIGTYNITDSDIDRKVSNTNLKTFLLKDSNEELYFQYNDIKDISLDWLKVETLKNISQSATEYRENDPLCKDYNNSTDPSYINDLYETRGYLREFYSLENLFIVVLDTTLFLELFQSLSNRLEKYIAKADSDLDVLDYLRVAILSRISNIKNDEDNYVVVDIHGYFPLVEKHLQQYNNALKEVKIDTYKADYENTINTQVVEADKLIHESILPATNGIFDDILDQLRSLVKEVIEHEKQTEAQIAELAKQQRKLSNQLAMASLLGVLKIASIGLNFLGPVGVIASSTAGFAIDVADTSMSGGVKKEIEKASTQFTNYYSQKHEQETLESNLGLVKLPDQKFIENDDEFKKVSDKVSALSKISNQSYLDEKMRAKDDLIAYKKKLSNQKVGLKENTDTHPTDDDEGKKQKIKWTDGAKAAIASAEAGLKLYNYIKNENDDISNINESIKQAEDEVIATQKYEQDLRNNIFPLIETVQNDFSAQLDTLSNQSQILLYGSKFKMENFLVDFRTQMTRVIQEPSNASDIKGQIMACIDKLQNGMSTVYEIYDRVQEYQSQAKLADYIADLESAPTINNPDFKEDFDKLELLTKSNLVLLEYGKATSTFQQYVFPYAELFFDQFDLSPYVHPENISTLVSHAAMQVDALADILITQDTTIVNKEDHVFSDINFNTKYVDQGPFYKWESPEYKQNISSLLQGKEVTIKVDITKGIGLNAVKFREIGIRFELANDILQNEFNEEAANFLISLTHLGNSYYRCNDDYYIFSHNLINMEHSVNTKNDTSDSMYSMIDDTYKLIIQNAALFSPYATWKMQLTNKSTTIYNEDDFKKLKGFSDHVIDIALEGRGGYINYPAKKACNDNVGKYYKQVEIVSPSRRRRRSAMNYFDDAQYASSSANQIKSPINTVFNFFSGVLGPMKSLCAPNAVNYNFFKGSIEYMVKEVKQMSVFTTTYEYFVKPTHFMSTTTFDVNGSLLLADFFMRWLTDTKHLCNIKQSMDSSQARALALDIITNFEETLQRDFPDKVFTFDPVVLMSNLEKEIINNNCTEIEKILYKSVIKE